MQTGILFERNDDMADTEKKTAKYRFLVDTIKEKIKNGEYEPGDRGVGIAIVHDQKRQRCRKRALVDI